VSWRLCVCVGKPEGLCVSGFRGLFSRFLCVSRVCLRVEFLLKTDIPIYFLRSPVVDSFLFSFFFYEKRFS